MVCVIVLLHRQPGVVQIERFFCFRFCCVLMRILQFAAKHHAGTRACFPGCDKDVASLRHIVFFFSLSLFWQSQRTSVNEPKWSVEAQHVSQTDIIGLCEGKIVGGTFIIYVVGHVSGGGANIYK